MFSHLFWPYNKYLRPEFFPEWICYASVKIFVFWKALWARSVFWITATNPWFPLGGLYPTSKWEVLKHLPQQYVPQTIRIQADQFTKEAIVQVIEQHKLSFPCVIKPDNGLRWLGVEIFHTQKVFDQKIDVYIQHNQRRWAWLIQDFVQEPQEFGIFYVRMPHEERGRITWIVKKEFLSLTGDGVSTVKQLVHRHPRARYHLPLLTEQYADVWQDIMPSWERMEIVEIGTHSRWSTFVDVSDMASQALVDIFDELSKQVPGFFYGRYDVRTKDMEALLHGNYSIMEINPTYGEPTWMYDPSYSFWQQQAILLQHRSLMYTIAMQNHQTWVPFASFDQWREAHKQYIARKG